MHKFITKQLPIAFNNIYEINAENGPYRRQIKHLKQPFSNCNYRLFTTSCLGPKLWNECIAPQFPVFEEIPTSKMIIKNLIRRQFISSYNR